MQGVEFYCEDKPDGAVTIAFVSKDPVGGQPVEVHIPISKEARKGIGEAIIGKGSGIVIANGKVPRAD